MRTRSKIFLLVGALAATLPQAVQAQAANPDGTGFAGAYAPSKTWQPPKDPAVREKLNKFQDLKFGFFYCWGTQTQ